MKRSSLKYIIILCLISFIPGLSSAQNAPVTTCGAAAVAAPGNFSVPVSVTGFNNIGAISLTLDYDYSVAQFIQGTPHPQLYSFTLGDADLGNGFHRISMGWYGAGTTLADGSVIMTIVFNYTSGNSDLVWYDNGTSCEYADGNYNVLNDIPTSAYYINGNICAMAGTPGPISGMDTICAGQEHVIYSIEQVPNATGYNWTVPSGAVIISGQGTNSITVDYSFSATSGMVEVFGYNACGSGASGQLPVTAAPIPVADPGDDQAIPYGTSTTLYAAPGGPGNYSYHWSPEELLVDPDMQNPTTVNLTSTSLFTLLVTDLDLSCQNSGEVIVTVTGGPLGVNPTADPDTICEGVSSQLHANAGGGSGNYTYIWTCTPPGNPAWFSTLANPVVSPDTSTVYEVTVSDAFNVATGSVELQVNQLPTATISGGDTLCGIGATTLLPVELTGTPPWNFTYTFGNTSVFVYNQYTSPYYILAGETGAYSVSFIEDANCTGSAYGAAEVNIFPIPVTPEVTYENLVLHSSACCGNQWYLDNAPIPGATSQTFQVSQSGVYYDIVTLYGCSSDTSETIDVIVGMEELELRTAKIFPNPASKEVFIMLASSCVDPIRVRIFSLDGKLVREVSETCQISTATFSIDLRNLSPGLFFIEFTSGNIDFFEKLIII